MSRLQRGWALGMLVFALSVAWAQDSSTSAGAATPDTSQQQPVPAYGQDNQQSPMSENPPISGLDQPGLEPHSAPLSYIQPGATVSETVDSNLANLTGTESVRTISRGLGSLTLQRLWSHYDLAIQYMGGAAYYQQKGLGWKLMQQMDLDQKISWKRGQLSLRDSFSYLPEGNFGAAYGSLGSQGVSSLGTTAFGSFWGGSSLGTLGLVPRVMNVAIADVSESLTPKSSLTAAGGYALTHFYGTDPQSGISYLNNTQISGQVGYDRLLSAHTQVALVYGYQGFDFSSVGEAFHSHVIQVMYGHRISGRMDLLIGAGPQFTNINLSGVACSDPTLPPDGFCILAGDTFVPTTLHDRRIGVAARAKLRYHFPKTSLSLTYDRSETSGSGFFAGAQTDLAQFKVERPLTRVWSGFADLGFSRNSRLEPLTPQQLGNCGGQGQNPCPGINAKVFDTGFAGVGLHRAFGRNFHGFISYQFNELSFDNSYCGGLTPCSRISHRHVGTIGLDWTPRPIRID
jgi:hypothetical protein